MNPMAGEHIQRVTLPLEADVRAAAEEEAKLRNVTVKAILIYWLRKATRTFALSTLVLPCSKCGDDCLFGINAEQREEIYRQWEGDQFAPRCPTCLEAGDNAA